MLTLEQMVYAASQGVTETQVQVALRFFLSSAFENIEKLLGITFSLMQTPINNGLIGMTANLHHLKWSHAAVAVMGIRIYKSMVYILERLPETSLLVGEDLSTGKMTLKPEVIKIIAETPMSFDKTKGVVVFDEEFFARKIEEILEFEKKFSNS